MSSINKAILVGRVGKDPTIRTLNSGDKVASFTLATSESWKDKSTGERRDKTSWHTIVVFNEHIAKVVEQYVRKGLLVGVEGAIETRKYEQNGVEKYVTEIVLQRYRGELTLLGGKDDGERSTGGGGGGTPRGAQTRPGPQDLDDDVPFAPDRW